MTEQDETKTIRRTRFPDLLTIVVGVVALLASVYILTDGQFGFPSLEPRGLIAAGTLFVGALLLLSSVRGNRH